MITWLQTTFHKHFKWIFVFLLAVITVSFVFVLGVPAQQGLQRTPPRMFLGLDLADEEARTSFGRESSLSMELRYGPRAIGRPVDGYAEERLALLDLSRALGLPDPNPGQLRRLVQSRALFQNERGEFDPALYTRVVDSLASNPVVNEQTVSRVLAEDYRAEKTSELLSGPGFVLPWEWEQFVRLSETKWTVETATMAYAAFTPELTPTEEELKAHFEQTAARYEIPAQVVVQAVRFPAAEFSSQVNVTEAELEAFFNRNPARFAPPPPTVEPGQPTPPTPPAPTFAEVRTAVEAAFRLSRGNVIAGKAASDFAYALFESGVSAGSPELERFLAAQGRSPETIPAFARGQVPPGSNWPRETAEAAHALSAQRHYSDPLPAGDDFVVLLWRETIPPGRPSLVEVQERVTADWRESERRRRFIARGAELRTELKGKLAAGTAFADAARELGLEVARYAEVSARTPSPGLEFSVVQRLPRTPLLEVSDMIATAERGIFFLVVERVQPETVAELSSTPELRRSLAAYAGSITRETLLSAHVRAAEAAAGLDTQAVPPVLP